MDGTTQTSETPLQIQTPPILLRPADAARVLGISKRFLWELTAAGDIKGINISRSPKKRVFRYRLKDLQAYADFRAET